MFKLFQIDEPATPIDGADSTVGSLDVEKT